MEFLQFFRGLLTSFIANLLGEAAESRKNKINEEKLRTTVEDYLEKEKDRNGLYSIDEEYDYECLCVFLRYSFQATQMGTTSHL